MGKTQKRLKTSAEGRECKFPTCKRTLSIYNHEDYCRLHLQKEKDLQHLLDFSLT